MHWYFRVNRGRFGAAVEGMAREGEMTSSYGSNRRPRRGSERGRPPAGRSCVPELDGFPTWRVAASGPRMTSPWVPYHAIATARIVTATRHPRHVEEARVHCVRGGGERGPSTPPRRQRRGASLAVRYTKLAGNKVGK